MVTAITSYRVDLGPHHLGGRFFQVSHAPAGWPGPHSPVDRDGQLYPCPDLPVWKAERTGPRGKLTGHIGYYCDDDLPAEYRRAGSAS